MEEKLENIAIELHDKVELCDETIRKALSLGYYYAAAKAKERKEAYEEAIYIIAKTFF